MLGGSMRNSLFVKIMIYGLESLQITKYFLLINLLLSNMADIMISYLTLLKLLSVSELRLYRVYWKIQIYLRIIEFMLLQ